ncbi:MAG TPA: nucleoside phosphorylase [Bacteroidales bacterium]
MSELSKADLVFNADGKLYHINLSPGELATNIILVGDPARAKLVASFFDKIIFETTNREINTYTGTYNSKPISVMSTGMGTDNVEIVLMEIDALFNIDFPSGKVKQNLTQLNLIRIGTSGALQKNIPVVDSFLVSEYAIGLDGLAYFYEKSMFSMEREMTSSFINQMDYDKNLPKPYAVRASKVLVEKIGKSWRRGITLTAPGFYGPQGRKLRLEVTDEAIIDKATRFKYNGFEVTNFEMESSALYLLSAMLGHNALTVCDIIANRVTGEFQADYKTSMKLLIGEVLKDLLA